ncbi:MULTISPECIES: hypothetical protein [unclassified Janthinobacterium]|uniref:hypothetical protein n=1 Tax=unclassified Janthinobacterium TaxID=2610881 RepID=UPI00034D846B|nr:MULTISPECIES: hypothetical protein [unclassified Janthinobacterium]MEC5160089.1 2-keto-3-deoxy-galactonokinase [Janthinobacterium sp. CG_S6]
MKKIINATAVLDIGQTNVKLTLLDDDGAVLAERRGPNGIVAAGAYPHHDTERIWNWLLDGLAGMAPLALAGRPVYRALWRALLAAPASAAVPAAAARERMNDRRSGIKP